MAYTYGAPLRFVYDNGQPVGLADETGEVVACIDSASMEIRGYGPSRAASLWGMADTQIKMFLELQILERWFNNEPNRTSIERDKPAITVARLEPLLLGHDK